jgi:hypothetical protein
MAEPNDNTVPQSKTTKPETAKMKNAKTETDKPAAAKNKSDSEGLKTDKGESSKTKTDESKPADAGVSDGASKSEGPAGRLDQSRRRTHPLVLSWFPKVSPRPATAPAKGKHLWVWPAIGLLVVFLALLVEYSVHVSLELAVTQFTVRTLQDEVDSLKASDLGKCVQNLRSCVAARNNCLGCAKYAAKRERWLLSLQEEDFDICTATSAGEYYQRELQAMNVTGLDAATVDELKTLRKYKKRRMTKTWHPDKAVLDVEMHHKIMMRINGFGEELEPLIKKVAHIELIKKEKEYAKNLKHTPGSKNDMVFQVTWADVLSDIIEMLLGWKRRLEAKVTRTVWILKLIVKRNGIWYSSD